MKLECHAYSDGCRSFAMVWRSFDLAKVARNTAIPQIAGPHQSNLDTMTPTDSMVL